MGVSASSFLDTVVYGSLRHRKKLHGGLHLFSRSGKNIKLTRCGRDRLPQLSLRRVETSESRFLRTATFLGVIYAEIFVRDPELLISRLHNPLLFSLEVSLCVRQVGCEDCTWI